MDYKHHANPPPLIKGSESICQSAKRKEKDNCLKY